MIEKYLSRSELARLVTDLVGAGVTVIAPADHGGLAEYRPVKSLEETSLTAGPLPWSSLKGQFLPQTEVLFRYHLTKKGIELQPAPETFGPRVILGARPCDAAGVATVDAVMDWDYHDELWFGRRAATTIVSLACAGGDDACFCSAVGLGPDTKKGSDVLLTPAGDEGYVAEALTPKGEAFVAAHAARFEDPTGDRRSAAEAHRAAARAKVGVNLATLGPDLGKWLSDHFEDDYWKGLATRCHGCGACASVCPTCHCFDIVDEPEGYDHGARRRAWDTCQTGKFTIHASGHNPRGTQKERFRQRVLHKFSIYPARFGQTLCTGCGRCVRACPAGMDLTEVLGDLEALRAGPASPASETAAGGTP